jgi:hypothetical protein
MLWCLAALGAPIYNTDEITLRIGDATDAQLSRLVRAELARVGARLERPVEDLARTERLGLLVATATQERGGEFDLVVDGDLVSVWEDTPWRVARRPRPAPVAPRGGIDAVVARHGLGPASTVGDARWDADAAAALDAAIAVLTPAERARLGAVRWVRRARPVRSHATGDALHGATYIVDNGDARIEVYDDALIATTRFVGPLERPSSLATAVILHEIGHAIADAPIRALHADYDRRRAQHQSDSAALNARLADHNAAIERFNRARDPAVGARLTAESAWIRTEAARLNTVAAELAAARATLEDGQNTSPMARSFATTVPGAATAYGRLSADEAFAEAFALYHLDPAALERAQPGALAWFRAGRHTDPR